MMEIMLILGAMVVLLLLQGFFSGSEIALINADKLRLRHMANSGHKGAQLLIKLFKHPETILGTTLVGTNISLVTLTTLGTLLMIKVFGDYGDLIAFLIFTPFFLVFGEVVPKSVYQQKADQLAPRIIFPLRLFSLLFYPVVFVFSKLARLIVRLVGVQATQQSLFTTREQVRMVLESAEEAANIDIFDRDRLIRAVRFAATTVGEVMVPIAEVIMLSHRQGIAEAIQIAHKYGYFRLPVYQDEPGKIVGVLSLNVWDLMDPQLGTLTLQERCTDPYYVIENQPVDEILAELQHRHDHLAIVVDEFGSATGMITLEDLLAEVLGEVVNLGYGIENHLPRHKGKIEKLQNERYRIGGRVLLVDVADTLGVSLSHPDVHTVGGLLMKQLHHLPLPGESIVVTGYRFTVESVYEKGIKTIIVEPA